MGEMVAGGSTLVVVAPVCGIWSCNPRKLKINRQNVEAMRNLIILVCRVHQVLYELSVLQI